MESIIDQMVRSFERGGLTRRQLIQGLSVLVAGTAAPHAAAAQSAGFRGMNIDHVSVLVNDMSRSAAFYQGLFGMAPLSEDKPNQILRLGAGRTIVSLRHEGQPGIVDHFAIKVENFNKESVTQELKRRGITPQENIQFGFHIKDPDGAVVQIV